jgi:hypothetical protein
MAEQRAVNRQDAKEAQNALYQALRDHMVFEETQNQRYEDRRREDNEERRKEIGEVKELIEDIRRPLNEIMDSMPRDEQGKSSTYIHRVQHEEYSGAKSSVNVLKNGFLAKAGEMLFMALLILGATGHLGKWFN